MTDRKSHGPRRTRHGWRGRLPMVLASAGVSAYAVAAFLHPGAERFWEDFENITELLVVSLAALACVLRAKRERETVVEGEGRAWIAWSLIAAGLAAWMVGQIGWSVIVVALGEVPPEVSLLDGAYLLSPVLIVAGLLAMVRTPAGYLSNLRAVFEGVFIAAGVLLLSWTLVVGEVSMNSTTSTFVGAVNLAYPLLDVVAFSAVLFVAFWRHAKPPSGLGFLALGITCMAVADSFFWYMSGTDPDFAGSTPLDAGWVVAFLLIALAALQPVRRGARPLRRVNGRVLLAIPAVPAVVGVGAVLARWSLGGGLGTSTGVLLVMVAVVVLLGAGLLLTVSYENDALRGDLERRVADRTAELHATERYYRALVEHASDVVMVVGLDMRIRYVSDSLQSIYGFRPKALTGRHLSVFGEAAGRTLTDALELAALAQGQTSRVEWTMNDATERARHVESTITNLVANPDVGAFVLNSRDTTEKVELAEQMRDQAFHDPLTGLANRVLLDDRAAQLFARSLRTGAQIGAVVVDLDAFKRVNDSLGHQAGDELLCAVAQRLQSVARPGDTVARTGGDEFLALVDAVDSREDALALGKRFHDAIQPPFPLAGTKCSLTGSVGVALSPASKSSFEKLQADADAAMYSVKSGGKDAVKLFRASMRQDARERLRLQSDLGSAVENDELWLLYQPEFDIASERLDGFEALLRWNHPTRGLVRPGRFIRLAEESGLIVPIGRWVLNEALRQAATWHHLEKGSDAAPNISVNVSTVQLQAPSLLTDVRDALERSEIDPARVVLEITESSLIEDPDSVVDVLHELKEIGVRIAIDDFGTGYAALSYLEEMSVDILKVDQSFVAARGDRGRELLKAIIGIGQTLSLVTVVEGIEQSAQLSMVKGAGCDLAQGYLLGKPLSAEEARTMITHPSGDLIHTPV